MVEIKLAAKETLYLTFGGSNGFDAHSYTITDDELARLCELEKAEVKVRLAHMQATSKVDALTRRCTELSEQLDKAKKDVGDVDERAHQEYENNLRIHAENRALVDALAKIWQPIETAPKDGSGFIGASKRWVHQTHWSLEVGKGRWLPWDTYPEQPTHWMPFPEPPK